MTWTSGGCELSELPLSLTGFEQYAHSRDAMLTAERPSLTLSVSVINCAL